MGSSQCHKDIYRRGAPVCAIAALVRSSWVERWIEDVRVASGQPVDWHYVAGRVVVKCLGDRQKVQIAIRDLIHRLPWEKLDWA